MNPTLTDVSEFLVAAAIFVFHIYHLVKRAESRAKDLGDGGVQTLFGTNKPK